MSFLELRARIPGSKIYMALSSEFRVQSYYEQNNSKPTKLAL